MSRPRLLDLFCGAGGAACGYHRAGFEVVGVDIEPQPNYPFEFLQADALEVLAGSCKTWSMFLDDSFDAIHASPPCQAYSKGTAQLRAAGREYPDLLPATRQLLKQTGLPWIIENVPGAPMRADFVLCGTMFGLRDGREYLRRHRWFETSWNGFGMALACDHSGNAVSVVGHGPNSKSPLYRERRQRMNAGEDAEKWWWHMCCKAMGIDWMTRDELSESIPPAYTEFIGAQLLAHIGLVAT